MSFHRSLPSKLVGSSSPESSSDQSAVPKWLVLQSMLAIVAYGALLLQLRLVSRLAAASRRR